VRKKLHENSIESEAKVDQTSSVVTGLVNQTISLFQYFFTKDFESGDRLMDVKIESNIGLLLFGKSEVKIFHESGIFKYEGTNAQINSLVNTLTLTCPQIESEGIVTIEVYDKANSGKCVDSDDNLIEKCIQKATLKIPVKCLNSKQELSSPALSSLVGVVIITISVISVLFVIIIVFVLIGKNDVEEASYGPL